MSQPERGDQRITINEHGVEIDTPGTPLDMSWGCSLEIFVDETKGATYRRAVRAALGDTGLHDALAHVRERLAQRPPPPPDPAATGLPPDLAALVGPARDFALILAVAIGFPSTLNVTDFYGTFDDVPVPVDGTFTGRTTRIVARQVTGRLEVGLSLSASWWNDHEVAAADLRIYALDRSKAAIASIYLTSSPPWDTLWLSGENTSVIWESVAANMARSHFPGMTLKRRPKDERPTGTPVVG